MKTHHHATNANISLGSSHEFGARFNGLKETRGFVPVCCCFWVLLNAWVPTPMLLCAPLRSLHGLPGFLHPGEVNRETP